MWILPLQNLLDDNQPLACMSSFSKLLCVCHEKLDAPAGGWLSSSGFFAALISIFSRRSS
jgi:hypothetical protein